MNPYNPSANGHSQTLAYGIAVDERYPDGYAEVDEGEVEYGDRRRIVEKDVEKGKRKVRFDS